MLNDLMIRNAEALNFRHDRTTGLITCDDPDIWIEDFGTGKENVQKFILYLKEKKIGFSEPEDIEARKEDLDGINYSRCREFKKRNKDEKFDLTWVVGDVGRAILVMDTKKRKLVYAADRYRFEDQGELDFALSLIAAALSRFFPLMPGYGGSASRVLFTDELIGKIQSGSLFVSAE